MSDVHAGSEPETISLIALVDRFIEAHRTMTNRSFAFVLGAGASRSSGIKSAGEMVADWVRLLHREAVHEADGDGKGWATAETLKISKYDSKNPAASYSELYQRMYKNDPDRGYAYLEEQMRTAEPSYGYSVLARIMEDHQHKVVVTTNFDNLVADSLSIFSKTYPLVCGHESLAGFISARVRRPVVVKVHRDLLLAPKSSPEDLADLPEAFSKALAELFRHYTPIVIGYGGNDGSLMRFLSGLSAKSIPGGVYWCYWEGGPEPSMDIRKFVAEQRGSLVPIPGFDEAMMLIGNRLEFDVPDKFVRDRAEARAKRIVEQAQSLAARLARKKPLPASDVASSDEPSPAKPGDKAGLPPRSTMRAAANHPTASGASELAGELAKAVQTTMRRTSGSLRWWQWEELADAEPDLGKRDKIYQDAIAALPDSADILGNYAIFLTKIRKDHDKAEEYFTRALAAQPDDAITLGNYAIFLKKILKDHDKAETYYKKAIDAQPDDANSLSNYAVFLTEIRKDHDKAEEYFTRAITAQPDDANTLGNYATFLTNIRKEHDKAEEYFTRAITAQLDDANTLGNYARFLFSLDRTDEGLQVLQRAVASLDGSLSEATHAEVWMYAVCHWLPSRWRDALSTLKSLLVKGRIRTGNWDFSAVIGAAQKRGHPEAAWLEPLAKVCAGTAPPSSLDAWAAWRNS